MAVLEKIARLCGHPGRNKHAHVGYRKSEMITHILQPGLLHRHRSIVGNGQATEHLANADSECAGDRTQLPYPLPGWNTTGKGGNTLAKELL